MGNQNSRSTTPPWNPQSPPPPPQQQPPPNVTASHERSHHHVVPHLHHSARRRESIQALSTAKAQAAPPSASLAHAESQPTSTRPHSRGRSQTAASSTSSSTSTAAAVASHLRAAQDHFKAPEHETMGNEQSSQKAKEKGPPTSRQITPPQQPAASPPPEKKDAQHQHQHQHQPAPSPSPQTCPVNVPAGLREESSSIDAIAADADPEDYIVPSSHFSRPPRLPLPIEEELHNPGSPIISAQDLASPIDYGEVEGALPRRTSMLSTTTADDEDLGEEFKVPTTGRPTVPTLIEWEGPGERVYVTGTFAGWNKKYKLHPNGPSKKKDALSAYVLITPGTHHLMFIVDNDMRTSDKLPTAVDYTNILVNYLEVSYDDVPKPASDATEGKESLDAVTPVQERDAPTGVYPPQVLPPTPELQPLKAPLPEPAKPKIPEPTKKYHQNIPRYLLDLDAPEESSRFARSNATTNNLPTPPSLPGFLGKSILNGTTPTKDDSSVLINPNHTVLNHLATSSIKDNILATSATTRYKQKFLTTIMYKPKEEDPDRVY
ncbi:carbohydrate-binding module family 48 protein [Cucurbitaria berberidis CBS 394.84]|uniref:Carbohydrate-binding module family 48 protein n=1 Tax=Cucurbitaria berberidis CBS 394.84 TaxID=1168544 RepID=A0A9P4GSR8_9PLEO|nr:carbohydrate-binding module family 48 protein [Cucurbitaria berberidis CBS 394.84]KAF1850844.1 carbohydrate-binding module family 48 protein [Cucurbitaria berberidis CBS 394.84]